RHVVRVADVLAPQADERAVQRATAGIGRLAGVVRSVAPDAATFVQPFGGPVGWLFDGGHRHRGPRVVHDPARELGVGDAGETGPVTQVDDRGHRAPPIQVEAEAPLVFVLRIPRVPDLVARPGNVLRRVVVAD